MLGLPTYGWIGGRAKVVVRYAMFLAEIPIGFKGVQNIEKNGGEILITERETNRTTAIVSEYK